MRWNSLVLVISLLTTLLINEGLAHQVGNNPFRRAEKLDPGGKYLVEWEVDWNLKRITFNVTAETRNWIEFGLADNEKPTSEADVVVGGVDSKGQAYFTDRHKVGGNNFTTLDKHQDWKLHSAWENGTHTSMNFSRLIDTCDPEDYPIQMNKITLLWAYGNGDEENEINPACRGTYNTYLLDPDYAPELLRNGNDKPTLIPTNSNEQILKNTKVWSFEKSRIIPTNDTSYLCSVHKASRLQEKHHIIGFDIHLPNEQSRLRAHHLVMMRCHAPSGQTAEEVFEQHLDNPGEPCYTWEGRAENGDTRKIPMQLCSEIYIPWAMGAKTFFLPNHLGLPFGTSENEYYLMEIHYDNPQKEQIQVDIRMDFFYTNELRPNDAGVMGVFGQIPGQPEYFLIPPYSRDHRILAHCSSACTETMYPPSGISIAAAFLHSHNAGVGIRFRHFRGERELPWILYDDNYDNRAQAIRHLREDVKVMPGDQLTVDCKYNTDKDGVVGGFSTRQEMCFVFIVYYEKVKGHSYCTSGIDSPTAREHFLGIGNVSWVESELEWVVQTPANLSGLKVSQVSNQLVNWTPEKREQLQHFHEVQSQFGHCYKSKSSSHDSDARNKAEEPKSTNSFVRSLLEEPLDDFAGSVSYPFGATPYHPPERSCTINEQYS